MNASERYKNIFGEFHTLAERIPWTTELADVLEWLAWRTENLLGINKTEYRKKIVEIACKGFFTTGSIESINDYVENEIGKEVDKNDRMGQYDQLKSGVCSPVEALRRAKFFSEEYLNKEFDILWGLVCNNYLDEFYLEHISSLKSDFKKGEQWYCHGNTGLFKNNTGTKKIMQMDNLSYNPANSLLIANEIKLIGYKNPTQILKYAWMFKTLKDKKFISDETKLKLFFIGCKSNFNDPKSLIDKEIEHYEKENKKNFLDDDNINIANNSEIIGIPWKNLYDFNISYLASKGLQEGEVEYKLIWGFNESLKNKVIAKSKSGVTLAV